MQLECSRPSATALVLLAELCAACSGDQRSLEAREADCRAKGYPPATAALYECVHPEDAATLEKATEAWDELDRGEGADVENGEQ
jgi:hypothetical protein